MIIAYFKWGYHAIIGVTTYNWQRARTAVASEIGSQGDFQLVILVVGYNHHFMEIWDLMGREWDYLMGYLLKKDFEK